MRRGWDTGVLVLLVFAGVLATALIWTAGRPGSTLNLTVVGSIQVFYATAGLGFAVRAATFGRLPARLRRAWRMLLPAYALWLVTLGLYTVAQTQHFPSAADIGRLLIGPAMLIGILSFARLPAVRAERAKLRLDAALVAVGAAMVLWYVVVSPAFTRATVTWHEVVPSLLHPLFDAALLFGVGIVLLRGPGASGARLPLLAIVASILLTMTGDAVRAYSLNHGGPVSPTAVESTFWDVGLFCLMLAPFLQTWYARRATRADLDTEPARPLRPPRWPYLTVVPGYAVLMVTVGVRQPFPAGGLIVGAMLATSLVFRRQMVSAEESRRLAVTDALTGLANRVQLYEVLPRALARCARNGTLVGTLIIDMNGFKQINDTLGHAAGDRMLIGFGRLLTRCVLGSDLVVRLGGDEFAVILPELTDVGQLETVLGRIRAAMAEPIDLGAAMAQPSASIGAALSEPGEISADALINRADVQMYAVKKGAVEQTADSSATG